MFTLSITKTNVEKLIERINSWDDWYSAEESFFKLETWPELDFDQIDSDLEREDIVVDGVCWIATTNNYDVDPNLLYFYEYARWAIFMKLEPEAYLENLSNLGFYGKLCLQCSRYTNSIEVDKCPNCGSNVVLTKLND